MAAVRHLGFWKFNFLTVRTVKRPILYNRAKFREDRYDMISRFSWVFTMAAAAILVFEKF